MGIEVETFSSPLEKRTTSQQNTAPRHLPSSPRHRAQNHPTVGHRPPHNVEAPQCATPPANQLPQTHHTQKRWQRHTLLQTGYHSSARHRHSLPPGAKIGILEQNEKDKTALPSPISKLPSTRPALSKPQPPSLVLRKPLRIAKENRNPRYHLSSTSSCREMEKLSAPFVRLFPRHCHLPTRRTTSLPS